MIIIKLNGIEHRTESQHLAALISELDLQQQRFAVEYNGTVIAKSQLEQVTLAENDQIEIINAIGGG